MFGCYPSSSRSLNMNDPAHASCHMWQLPEWLYRKRSLNTDGITLTVSIMETRPVGYSSLNATCSSAAYIGLNQLQLNELSTVREIERGANRYSLNVYSSWNNTGNIKLVARLVTCNSLNACSTRGPYIVDNNE